MATATKREMMTYDRRAQLYHGDENFRKVTRLGKRKKKGTVTYWKGEKGGVSLENYKTAKTSSRHSPSRLCGPLDDSEKHIASVTRKTHYNNCAACGKRTAWKCGLCKKYMCVGKGGGAVKLHSTMIRCLASLNWTMTTCLRGKRKPGRLHLQQRRGLIESGRAMMMREDQGE